MKTRAQYIAEGLQEVIQEIKAEGLRVYGPEKLTSYVFFTDGVNVGYAQYDMFEGVKYCTEHLPNSISGTGYVVDTMQQAFGMTYGSVSTEEYKSIKKYKDFDTFRARYWQTLVEY